MNLLVNLRGLFSNQQSRLYMDIHNKRQLTDDVKEIIKSLA